VTTEFPPAWRETLRSKPAPWSLYLHGGVGTGKSCFAAALLMGYRKRLEIARMSELEMLPGNLGGCWIAADNLGGLMQRWEDWQVAAKRFERYPYLVIDDLGFQPNTDYVRLRMAKLLISRYEADNKTIITSNLSPDQLAKELDPRVASRLQDGVILYTGEKDMRRKETNP